MDFASGIFTQKLYLPLRDIINDVRGTHVCPTELLNAGQEVIGGSESVSFVVGAAGAVAVRIMGGALGVQAFEDTAL